jgi:uncharacterized protein with HEPN domain
MHSDRERRALIVIAENARMAIDFTRDLSADAFRDDVRTYYAVVRCLEIISEASRRLDQATQARHPHIPWSRMAGAGNVYRHDYEAVSSLMIWRTVQERMTDLIAACEAELDTGSAPAP